ncbi:MAG: SCP2 sterol-binding domain-containing protein [Acinetobacter sp.]|jgi:putative sterol carrier protein
MNINDFIKKLPTAVNAEAIDGAECIVQLNLSQPFVIKISDGQCEVSEGEDADSEVTLITSDEVFIDLVTGKTSGAMAFIAGKLKVNGDIMLAKELMDFFDSSKLA